MDNNAILMIGAVVVVVIVVVFYVMEKGAQEKKAVNEKNGTENSEDEKIFGKKDVPRIDMEKFMEFDRISNDMIIQKKDNIYTMVVQCKGINYDLMSAIEQSAVEEGFTTFLNTLRFPIQIYVQARVIDLKGSMQIYRDKIKGIEKECEISKIDITKAVQEGITSRRDIAEKQYEYDRKMNVLAYGQDIVNYVEKMSLNKQMLQRKFYIILSYSKNEIANLDRFSKEEVTQICYTELYTRARSLIGALQACSVSSTILDSNLLGELLYVSYNRDDEKILDIQEALKSGFYRLYSESQDIQEKKDEVLYKEYLKESSDRIQEMIKFGVSKGSIEIAGEEASASDELVDKVLMKYIAESELDIDVKDALSKEVIQKHIARNDKKLKDAEEAMQAQEQQARPVQQVVAQPMQQARPVQQVAQPVQQARPVQQVAQPVQQARPVQQVAQPVQQARPVQQVAQPVQQARPVQQVVAQPVQQVVAQPVQQARPVQQVAQPVQQAKPVQQVAQPTQQVVQPGGQTQQTVPLEQLIKKD